MSSEWTVERREQARLRCLKNQPWLASTGPRSKLGKLIVSQNAIRDGWHSQHPIVREAIREEAWEAQTEQFRPLFWAFLQRDRHPPEAITDARNRLYANRPRSKTLCPRCLSTRLIKKGVRGESQRLECLDCKRRFQKPLA